MGVNEVRNVNEALTLGLKCVLGSGIREDSRNGKVIVHPDPVVTEYARP